MAEMNKATVHASERVSARDMIQTPFEGDEDLSLKTDKDVAKMKKKAEKDDKAARAALAAHQVWSMDYMTGHDCNIPCSSAPIRYIGPNGRKRILHYAAKSSCLNFCLYTHSSTIAAI